MREQLAEQVVGALGRLLKAKHKMEETYKAVLDKSSEAVKVLPAGLVLLKNKPVPSLTAVSDDISTLLIQTLGDLLTEWEQDTISAMEPNNKVDEGSSVELLVDLGTFAFAPLVQELRALLMKQAEKYVDQAAEELGFQLHKAMVIARKEADGVQEDENVALMPTSGDKVESGVQLVQKELVRLLKKLHSDLNNKLESKVAGRFLGMSSKLFSKAARGEQQLGQLGTKAQTFEEQLRKKLPKDE